MASNSYDYSKWGLLARIYKAKHSYYVKGSSSLTDQEYDALESSFVNIHGAEAKKEWICVGYDSAKHLIIQENFQKARIKFNQIMKYTKFGSKF
jgi:NAD-dependent DNA ligase